MINENLHKQPVALDRLQHRALRLDTHTRDLTTVKSLNAFFVTVAEFGECSRDYPVVFVATGKAADGQPPEVAPVAVFGLQPAQNLCVENDLWRTRYVPLALRLYPFAMARVPPDQLVLVLDNSWPGFQAERGEALFDGQGEPSAFTLKVRDELEAFEHDVERTRLFCAKLVELKLLREMRFDAQLPDGQKVVVDGFLTIDDAKVSALSDAEVLMLHKTGGLGLIHAHQISLGNMTRLAEWLVARRSGAAAA